MKSTAYHLKQLHITLKQESQRNKTIAENNVSFLNLVPYKNMQPLSLNLFHGTTTTTTANTSNTSNTGNTGNTLNTCINSTNSNTPIQLSCTVLVTTNLDNTSLFAEYIQLSNAVYVNTDGIHIPKDYKLLKGLCYYLQPYYYNKIEDEPAVTKDKSNSSEESHKRSKSLNVLVGEVTILKTNIDLPQQLLLKIGLDYLILADLYDVVLREIGYDILNVNAVGNSLEITSPSIQIQCKSFKASELSKQIDKQIDLHHGTREVEVFAENSNAVEINFDKVIPSVDRGHRSIQITSPRQINDNNNNSGGGSSNTSTPPLTAINNNNSTNITNPSIMLLNEPLSPASDHDNKFDVLLLYYYIYRNLLHHFYQTISCISL